MKVTIAESSQRLLAGLDLDTLRRAEQSAHACSDLALGCALPLRELLELLLAAKVLAVGDDFARGEAQGLHMWLTRHCMPMVVQRHLLDVDASSLVLDAARWPADCLHARRLLWIVASLASFEGLRPGPRARAEALGERLGLPAPLVRVLVEDAQVAVTALLRGDDPLLRSLTVLRAAIFDLG